VRVRSLIALLVICSVGVSSFSTVLCARSAFEASATPESFETRKPSHSKLRKHDRLRLVEAEAQGEKELTLLIASVEGANQSVLRQVASLGGSVQYRDDEVSYLRVQVPTENVEKLARSADIRALNINGMMDYLNSPSPEPSPGDGAIANLVAPPGRNTPAENPYLPGRDIGSPQFIAQHPTFDGRGVTIAILDSSIDLLSAELQTAKTLDGRPTRKLADVLTAERDAVAVNYENSRISGYVAVNMGTELMAHDGKVTHDGVTYTVPALNTFRLGILNERMNNAKEDLNRDGNPENSSGLFAVLWDEKTNTVWVDTDQDHSFINENPLTDYHVKNDVGVFGKDDPATPIRETVGFTVQTDAPHKVVYILPGYSGHGTGVAGVAAGKNFFGGQINGIAPEAQIVSVPFGGPFQKIFPSVIESIILAIKQQQVDVVSVEIGFVMPFNDGGSTLSIICDRLSKKYNKLIFWGSGNFLGSMNSVGEGSTARRLMAVGSYISRETARTNYGVVTAQEHNLDAYTGYGPAKNGAFKPNILAPTRSLTTWPGFLPSQTSGTYELPPGYAVMGGTSTSTPVAAGAAALLISAAKQSGVRYDADRLRWAIMSSARYLDNYGAYQQGAGCFQVGAAWEALKKAPEPIEIVSRAPVLAALSQALEQPNQGVGIFEREGWSAGKTGQRSIVLTRISGEAKPISFDLSWLGNDGTFTSPATVTLPLNSPVTIPIAIIAKTPGVHSAILNLDIPGGPGSIYQVMNTIVVAEQFTADSGFSITEKAEADWMGVSSWYLNVPAGTMALTVDVKIAQGNVRPSLTRPSGNIYWPLALRPTRFTDYQGPGTWSRIISRPEAGVWQVNVSNSNQSPKARLALSSHAVVTMNATILTAITQTARPLELLPTDSNYTRNVSFTNQLGAFLGGVAELPLGSAFSETSRIDANRPPQVFELTIPPGTRTLNARIEGANETSADLDLYLFDCTKGTCQLKDFSANDGPDEEIYLPDPAAGKWKVLVDPFSVQGSTKFTYFDFFSHPAFGVLKSIGNSSYRPSGATWTERVNITVQAMPTGSRYLAGLIAVTAQSETKQPVDPTIAPTQDSPDLATVPLGITKITVRKIEKASARLPQ
jgi:subtilase family protein